SFRNRGWTVLLWIAAVAAAFGLSSAFAGTFSADYSAPGSDSKVAQDLLKQRFPEQSGDTITVVVHADAGLASPGAKAAVDDLMKRLAGVSHVKQTEDPYTPGSVSSDGRTAVGRLRLDVVNPVDMPKADTHRLLDLAGQTGGGVTASLGGMAVQQAEQGAIGSEGI